VLYHLQHGESVQLLSQVVAKSAVAQSELQKFMKNLHDKEAKVQEEQATVCTVQEMKEEYQTLLARSSKYTLQIAELESQLIADKEVVHQKQVKM